MFANKTIILFVLLTNIAVILSCDKELYNVSCNDCVLKELPEIQLEVEFDSYRDKMYQIPEIKVYEGNIEDGIVVATKISPYSPVYLQVYINKKYTVTATYYYYGKIYIVVDTVMPYYVYSSEKCDHPCYFLKNNKVSLHLKYT
jgi:hypothetical protein